MYFIAHFSDKLDQLIPFRWSTWWQTNNSVFDSKSLEPNISKASVCIMKFSESVNPKHQFKIYKTFQNQNLLFIQMFPKHQFAT